MPARPRTGRLQAWYSEPDGAGDLDFGLATSVEVFDAALRLVHDQYVSRGYMPPHSSGRRLSLHYAQPTTKIFVARRGSEVLGTLSVVEDSALGLPMDEIYRDELQTLRSAGRHIAEASALALRPSYRALGIWIVVNLIRQACLYSFEFDVDDVCIAVNPRHVPFYRKALVFETMGSQKSYRKVSGAPAVGMRIDIHYLRDVAANGDPAGTTGLWGYMLEREIEPALARLREDVPWSVLTPAQFDHFFAGHECLEQASPDVLRLLRALSSGGSTSRATDPPP